MKPVIRPAAPADAVGLSIFAARTFREAFGGDNNPADLARYLDEAFTHERQAAEINDPDCITLLAEEVAADGRTQLIGYVQLVVGAAPAVVTGPDPIELKRLYVAQQWHGAGTAHALLDAALHAAQARGARTCWLGVWERNKRAIAFYGKHGFQRVGEHTFMLGSDPQTDWLLARAVNDE